MVFSSMNKIRNIPHVLAQKAGARAIVFISHMQRVPIPEKVMEKLPRGAVVILRDYDHNDRAALAVNFRKMTRKYGLLLFVAGDIALARKVGADGVHLPQYMLRARCNAFGLMISAACHDAQAIRRAEAIGVNFILISPIFETASHKGECAMGVHRLSRLMEMTHLPVVALGGVNGRTAGRLKGLKINAVAAIDGLK